MTYFGFLLRFLLLPILLFGAFLLLNKRYRRAAQAALPGWPIWGAITLHVVIAVLYTTPWDNYLVATRVWWYDPALVTGFTIGWVPIEEYTFFVVQPILAALWLYLWAPRLITRDRPAPASGWIRVAPVVVVAGFWLASVAILVSGWQPGTYLALELGWALPPIALQLAFGADILWQQRRLVLAVIVPLTLYLSAADALAIDLGTWTINPEQSLHLLLGGVLPLEELLFFLLTNTLLTFGVVLVGSAASHVRIQGWLAARKITFRLSSSYE